MASFGSPSLVTRLFWRSSLSVSNKSISKRCMSSSKPQPVIELREYSIKPGKFAAYMEATTDSFELRKSISPVRFFSFPETGGELFKATHAYYYQGGLGERDEVRTAMAANSEWKEYLGVILPHLDTVKSNIFVEAPFVSKHEEVVGLEQVSALGPGNNCILELRRYNLKLGYDTVPKFLEYYGQGLPSKLAAEGTDPTTSLVTVMYAEVGRLNEVIEIWRHGNGTAAMEQSRVAARGAKEWRTAISNIAELAIEFNTTIHKPTVFSPLK